MCAAVVPRVRPASTPRAYWSQCGAPRPANAGTRYTPCGSVTCAASASTSDDDLMIPRPSRSHCTTAPAMKMLPSSAYSLRWPMRHATVVSRLCLDVIGFVPVFISMKQPVPYVFFTMPGWVHAWPNSAACWSPAMPAMGIEPPSSVVSPYTSLDEPTAGNTERGTPNSFSSSSSQSPVRRLNRDRKSTRLNSSHLVISYAVFCLKKKNNPLYYFLYGSCICPFSRHTLFRTPPSSPVPLHSLNCLPPNLVSLLSRSSHLATIP